jgi:pilus assembly protein CpaB
MKKTLILSCVFAFLSAGIAFLYFSSLEKSYKSMADPVTVVVARQRIPQAATLKPEHFEEISVPKEYVQPKAFNSISALFPKNSKSVYVSLTAIEKGEQILSTKISKPNDATGVSNIIPDGYKALSLEFDNYAQGILAPGSNIDIIIVLQYADKDKRVQEAAHIVAQNVLVLAAGDNFLGMPQKKDDENSRSNSSVAVAVTIEQAQVIMLAQENGKVRYVIRPAGDNDVSPRPSVKISDIVKDISSAKAENINRAPLNNNAKEIMDIINRYK